MAFLLHSRLEMETQVITQWPLSLVLLKNDITYPWLVLVPCVDAVQDIYELPTAQCHQLMDEICRASHLMQRFFRPDKLNIANLGNVVSQLHIHIVGRFIHDPLWPQSVWQTAAISQPYTETRFNELCMQLREQLQ